MLGAGVGVFLGFSLESFGHFGCPVRAVRLRYGAFVIRLRVKTGVNILEPTTFAFLIIGCMIPYWFAALTMKSVGKAAGDSGIPVIMLTG